MREHTEPPSQYTWIVYAVAITLVGGIAGYILGTQPGQSPAPTAVVASSSIVNEPELRAYRDVLARDPKNLDAAVKAGNLLYDAQRYVEAIGFYQQAFALNATDINVSTDLGTALWYVGRPDEALAQYDKSLALNPTHAQTLFNVGIVRADGKGDNAGAVAAWEQLLKANPDYPAAARVATMMAAARQKLAVTP
ncbi:MAG TPA: tetratricopeptide repeat protein [Vicinamibacterales bacterium]|jgi:tetratricopeptide (TPR) repeat protein